MIKRTALAAVVTLMLAGCGGERRVEIIVRTHDGVPIANTKLGILRFGFLSSRRTPIGEVTTNRDGIAFYTFSTFRDYAVNVPYKECSYVGGNFTLTGEQADSGRPMVISLFDPVCAGEVVEEAHE